MKVNCLIEMIATGSGSQCVMAAITEREAKLREIANQTAGGAPLTHQTLLGGLPFRFCVKSQEILYKASRDILYR